MNASRPALSRCAHPLTPCSTADQGVRDPADRQQPSGAEARQGKPHVTDSFPLTLPWLPTSCRAPKTGPAVREREREAAPRLSGKDLLRRPWQRPPRGAGREVGSPGPGRAAPAKASPTRNPTYPRRTVPPAAGTLTHRRGWRGWKSPETEKGAGTPGISFNPHLPAHQPICKPTLVLRDCCVTQTKCIQHYSG